MISLPDTFKRHGFTYSKIRREGRVCLYEIRIPNDYSKFKVFVVKHKPEMTFNGVVYPEKEVMPVNSGGSIRVWSFRSFEKATKQFNSLINKELTKQERKKR